MNNPIDQIRTTLSCADADLQGMLQRRQTSPVPSYVADIDDASAAKQTRADIAVSIGRLNREVTGIVKVLQEIVDLADAEPSDEHTDPIGDALEGLNSYLDYLKGKNGVRTTDLSESRA